MSSKIQSLFRTGTYFPQSKQTHFVTMLTLLMVGHLFLPHDFQQTNSLSNLDTFSEALSFQEALTHSKYDIFAKGICTEECTQVNSYYYRFNSLNVELKFDGILSTFSGDILMHESGTSYLGNYFSYKNLLPSNKMFVSRNIMSRVKDSMTLEFLSQGQSIVEYNEIIDEMNYPHYGFDSIFFNKNDGLIVIGYNDALYQSLTAREKVSRMVFSTREDDNLSQIYNFEEISFKIDIFVGLVRENQNIPQFYQMLYIQLSILLWVFVIGWFIAILAYYFFYYGINVFSLNKTKVLYFSLKWSKLLVYTIESISVFKSWIPSGLILFICFFYITLFQFSFNWSIFQTFLVFFLMQILTLNVIVLLGIRFHFGKIIKRKK